MKRYCAVLLRTGLFVVLLVSSGVKNVMSGNFDFPSGLAIDGTNLYIADYKNNTIRKIELATGRLTTFAGATSPGSQDGTRTTARFKNPSGLVCDGTNLYITDYYNDTIRKIVIATGTVTTIAGLPDSHGRGRDGTGAEARFSWPSGITTDGLNLYIADYGNGGIRKIAIATGTVTTLAGMGGGSRTQGQDGIGIAADFWGPHGITIDRARENLYVTDSINNTIRKIVIATGLITTIAGRAGSSGHADGTGAAARFYGPADITIDENNLYVADAGNYTIRKIVITTGAVTTLAGKARSKGSLDGIGTAARFDYPSGITNDGTNLYVSDTGNNTIRKITIATKAVTTIAGTAGSPGSADNPQN
jgi:DNA-binding beta-propeller fold protein YncE